MENKKITLKDFFESSKKLAIHCDTEEKTIKLLTAFDKMGKKWSNDTSYLKCNLWGICEVETCYSNKGLFSDKVFYLDNNYTVYEFEEIEL